MRKVSLIVIPLALVALLVLFHVLPNGEYRLPFADLEVASVTLYLSSESAENGKKHITAEEDVDAFLDFMDGMKKQGKYCDRDLPDGGHFLGIAFHLTDGSTLLCSYLETSQYGRGYFTDGEQRFEVSNLRLLDYWNTFDGEAQPLEDGETAQFPSIWANK